MKQAGVVIEKMISVDNTGMPKAPDIRQIQDKDVALLWSRDTTQDKRRYLKEAGVIYYLADINSPPKQQGFSESECLRDAIENYNLPKDYKPDALVAKLIDKYYLSNTSEAAKALEALQRSIHLSAIAGNRINELMSKRLAGAMSDEDVQATLDLMDNVNKRILQIPSLTKALATAYENMQNQKEETIGRGQTLITSSMDADAND